MKKAILFVCLGNICRSPAAEGFLRHLISEDGELSSYTVASCGIGDWHHGKLPDSRMIKSAGARGVTLSMRAQSFKSEFFSQFDLILAADKDVEQILLQYASSEEDKGKISLITKFSEFHQNEEIPDPYYEDVSCFERALDIIEDSCQGLYKYLVNNEEK